MRLWLSPSLRDRCNVIDFERASHSSYAQYHIFLSTFDCPITSRVCLPPEDDVELRRGVNILAQYLPEKT